MLLGAPQDIPRLPITREPRPANPWQQSVSLTCGSATYRVIGYGAAYPLGSPVRITVNRRPFRGPAAALLARDLSTQGAAYRIAGLCSRDSSDLELVVYRGLASPGRAVAFHVGAAQLSRRGEIYYPGMEEADAETFWFR
jgi:hypothetical protein